jgi:capsular polysaccharide biosynthesis protein
MIHEIRELMLNKCRSTSAIASPVVFIGRQDNDRNRRSLVNETEVLKHLESIYGDVQVIRPGVTKISETVKNIRGAKILIGPTGGNLAHLIWASNLELFVEIVPSGYPGITETQELSVILGFDYLRVDSNSVQNEEWVYSDQECRLESLRDLHLLKPSP